MDEPHYSLSSRKCAALKPYITSNKTGLGRLYSYICACIYMFVPIILKKSDCQFGRGMRELLGGDLGGANDRKSEDVSDLILI